MQITNKREALVLVIGDLVVFFLALLVMVTVRYAPEAWAVMAVTHLAPFKYLFIAWIFIYFVAGLYEKQTLLLQKKLPARVVSAQVVNIVLAVLFFYFIPYFGLTPKTNLFIYLLVSTILVLGWRFLARSIIALRRRYSAVVIGGTDEVYELTREVEANPRYRIGIKAVLDPSKLSGNEIVEKVGEEIKRGANVVVLDAYDERIENIFSDLYALLFKGTRFVDLSDLYEEVFDRVALSVINDRWFLRYLTHEHKMYDSLKRIIDIFIAALLGALSLIIVPLVAAAMILEGGGSIFYHQERLGRNGKRIRIVKFRTMTAQDSGKDALKSSGSVTRVGAVLRATRLDELPQLWNVLKGELSLVGPRPEIPELANVYEREVPYYSIRHLIDPGLSGWAQMYQENHPHHGVDSEATREKLSYDLYYIKNRSLLLDIKIALKTLKVFFSRMGR